MNTPAESTNSNSRLLIVDENSEFTREDNNIQTKSRTVWA
jgi:hypothetical protein